MVRKLIKQHDFVPIVEHNNRNLIFKHPTKRQTTYQLSKDGLNIGNKLEEDFKKTL